MRDKEYLKLAAQIPCIVCKNEGLGQTPASLHHPRIHTGLALKANDRDVIALCHTHHQGKAHGEVGYHHSPEEFENRYGKQEELLEQMKEEVKKLEEMYILR